MDAAAPRLVAGPRAGAIAAVAAFHAAAIAALILMPGVRERLIPQRALLVVQVREEPRERPPEAKPLPPPVLREPMKVEISPPVIALAPEIPVTPPAQPRPTITGPIATPPAPPAPAATPAPVQPPRFDMAYLRNPAPAYPTLSRRAKEQGRVLLHVLVSAGGEAQSIEVRDSSGFERLDRAAIDAVRRWRFAPARRGSEAIAAWALVPILFQLDT